jgi:hypothetical protein
MAIFFRLRASRAGIFSDLPKGEPCPLRIPVLRKKLPEDLAAVSPIDKSRKYEALPTVDQKKGHMLHVCSPIFEHQSTQNPDEPEKRSLTERA